MMSILKDLVEKEKYEKDNDKKYAEQLRLVADELLRAAHQIENPHADEIKWVKWACEWVLQVPDELHKWNEIKLNERVSEGCRLLMNSSELVNQLKTSHGDEIRWFKWACELVLLVAYELHRTAHQINSNKIN